VIHAEVADRVTFATHQCDIPVIADLAIENPGTEALEGLTLSVSCEPPVLGERTWTIDRILGGGEMHPRDRRVTLAGGLLDSLTERVRAQVRFRLCQGDAVLAETRHPITALARNEWGGARFMPELLAAFVTPNDPAVQRLLREASEILRASGKRSSLEGYQARSRTRTWEIVAAIWAAVTRRALTYAEPPASFGRDGQKIRLPSMIEQEGLATCLDTALLFAAAIEQAGIYPLVVLTEGHALAGAWLQPQTLPALTVDDPMEIRKAIANDELIVFEATMATGDHALPLSRAIAEGKRQLDEQHEAGFIYALDIRRARGRDIQPLSSSATPAEVRGAGGADAARAAPPLDVPPELPPFDTESVADDRPQTPAERLQRWQRSLLDLCKRNRLLNLRPSATAIPVFCPDPALLEDKVAQSKRIKIITPPQRQNAAGEPDATLYHLRTGEDYAENFAREALERNEIVANVDDKSLEKGLIELYRKARADFEEGGANTLFLALGMLRWSPPGESERYYRAPLILLPVRLERRSAASTPFLTAHEDEPVFNLTLLQMLRQDFHVDLPGMDGELPRDDHGIDVRQIWNLVRARIREVAGFEVLEDVVLSTFSFAKYLMWKDLVDRTETLKASPFVRHLVDTPGAAYAAGAAFLAPEQVDHATQPADLLAPLNADSSQLVAIHASGRGGDFVLEGPPGTGKSETIANIIAHNIGRGERVLFVSEKMAALEVVYRRLAKCGLGEHCLELHSARASKKAVLEQLDAAWGSSAAQTEAQWHAKADELKALRAQLNGLVHALHQPGPGGISPRAAVGRALRYGDVHRFQLDWERDAGGAGFAPTPEALAALEDLAKRLGQQFSALQPEDFTAFGGVSQTEWSYAWAGELVQAAKRLSTAIDDVDRRAQAFASGIGLADAGDHPDELAGLAGLAEVTGECARFDLGFALDANARQTQAILEQLLAEAAIYRTTRQTLGWDYPDAWIAAAPVQSWQRACADSRAKLWPLRLLARRRLRKEIRNSLGAAARGLPAPEQDLDTLAELAGQQASMTDLAKDLPAGSPWQGLASDPATVSLAVSAGRRLRAAVARLATQGRDFVALRAHLRRRLCEGRDQLEAGLPLAQAAADLTAAYAELEERHQQFRAAAGERTSSADAVAGLGALKQMLEGIVSRERRLQPWCAWVGACREAREAGLGRLITALEAGAVAPDDTVEAFRTAYACWLAPILIDARPELTRFSGVRHEDLIETFQKTDEELAELTAAYIRAKLAGQVATRDAPDADPGYGVLARQLQRRGRHMPVRQLVAEMGEALTALTPCLLMSPLSVTQFLPAEVQAFDLVVFDEASQITVPDAIGAIARGKRCIVVGDPKQLPPTRFFERGAEEDENEEASDLESILDEALAARVPHHRLTGHYRSRHESLICFSNHTYYQGALVTYPSADTAESAVSLREVPGVYARGRTRTNDIEARALVQEAVARLSDPRRNHLSLGIVTLNSDQKRLIDDLLDEARRKDPELEPFFDASNDDAVFVKNLETVQGDERDVILMSIGYGPTAPGAQTMSMNFGPLNQAGGERRLNVAITRATTEVVVFASFNPSMLDLTRTSAEAVRDLKHYLELAERGPRALGEAIQTGHADRYDSDFELAVAEALRARGWSVRTQIGVSKFRVDLGVVSPDAPGRFLAGIECDGATYHSSPSARDRDRVRQIVLERLGWRLLRLWSTEYFRDPDTALETIDRKLTALLDADREEAAQRESAGAERPEAAIGDGEPASEQPVLGLDRPAQSDDSEQADPDAEAAVEQGGHAVPADAPTRVEDAGGAEAALGARIRRTAAPAEAPAPVDPGAAPLDPDRFYELEYRTRLRRLAEAMIDAEGPITFKRLCDRIARAHGFQRTGRQIRSTVWKACARTRHYNETPDGHQVFWPAGREAEPIVAFRGLEVDGGQREWREIPYPEKLALVQSVMRRRSGDVPREVGRALGIGRVTTRFREEIAALERALQDR